MVKDLAITRARTMVVAIIALLLGFGVANASVRDAFTGLVGSNGPAVEDDNLSLIHI